MGSDSTNRKNWIVYNPIAASKLTLGQLCSENVTNLFGLSKVIQ